MALPDIFLRPAIDWAERQKLPDAAIRFGIRRMLAERAAEQAPERDPEGHLREQRRFRAGLRASPIALVPDQANEQHYELPPAFFERVLGPRLKYSS